MEVAELGHVVEGGEVVVARGNEMGEGEDAVYQGRLEAERHFWTGLMPEELWVLVLDMLVKPEDLINASNSSPYFRHLLQPTCNLFQFPAVLEQLIQNVYKDSATKRPLQQILKSRTVCKSWKDTVDNRLLKENRSSDHGALPRPLFISYAFCIHGFDLNRPRKDRPEKFLSHFSETHEIPRSNPFCVRQVTVYHHSTRFPDEQEDDPGYDHERENGCFQTLRTLMSHYGAHVWDLELQALLIPALNFSKFDRLLSLLELTPNLQCLTLNIHCDQFTADQLNQINFPKIPSLQKIILDLNQYIANFPAPLKQSLLDCNNHITQLHICRDITVLATVNLPNLKELKISRRIDEIEFLALDQPQVSWPLEKLWVQFAANELQQPAQVFGMIGRKWGHTLKDLSVTFGHIPNHTPFSGLSRPVPVYPFPDLPQLERLYLAFTTHRTWGFISGSVENLKHLEIYYSANRNSADYRGFDEWMKALENPLEGNLIWETFPKLETLIHDALENWRPRSKTYTRAAWKKTKKLESK